MKSIQFIDLYYPNVDGVIHTVDRYATHMDAAVVAPIIEKGYQDKDDYPIQRTRSARIPFVGYGWPMPEPSKKLKDFVNGFGADIFHVHSPFMLGHYALKRAKKLGIPVVSTFHSKYYDDFKRVTGSEWFARFGVRYIVKFYNQCDVVWACSAGTAQTLREYGYKGEIAVMPNGADPFVSSDLDSARAAAAERFAIPKDKKILLFVGQMVWQKNLKLVLDTLATLDDSYRLLLVGTGYYEKQIHEYARQIGVMDRCIFTGRISDRVMLEGLYLCGDLFFFPSVYDNAPLVLREAACAGVPALLVRGSNAAECVTDNENGYLAEESVEAMSARIGEIFADPQNRQATGQRAKQTIPVPWEELAKQVEAQYAAIVERHGRK